MEPNERTKKRLENAIREKPRCEENGKVENYKETRELLSEVHFFSSSLSLCVSSDSFI